LFFNAECFSTLNFFFRRRASHAQTAAPVRGYAAANPRGTFLFATESDRIEAFAVDPDGVLTSLGTFLLNNTGDPKARSLVIH
jgi:hypothetical protein